MNAVVIPSQASSVTTVAPTQRFDKLDVYVWTISITVTVKGQIDIYNNAFIRKWVDSGISTD